MERFDHDAITSHQALNTSQHIENLLNTSAVLFSSLTIHEKSRLFLQSLTSCPTAIIISDQNGVIDYVNDRFIDLFGYTREELSSIDIWQLVKLTKSVSFYRHIIKYPPVQAPHVQEFRFKTKNGQIKWQIATVVAHSASSNHITHFIAYFEDITENKMREQTIKHMSLYDQLTDLPNRAMFDSQLRLVINQAYLTNQKVAVALIDLDRFKNINDTLGHDIGDNFIKLAAKRLFECLSEKSTIARMGGDEFMVLLPAIKDFKAVFKIIQKLMSVFNMPFHFNGHELHIKASIGIALYPEDGKDALSLVKNADSALYEAKNSGRNHYKFYTAKLNASAFEQLTLETALRQALKDNQFVVYYQPQVDLKTGKIVGMEALVRWMHPEMGLVPPDQFISLAEETGLIVPLGKWVLKTACQQAFDWHQMGFDHLRLAVNLSARQFQEPELVETVLGICQEIGIRPESLELEITESILMKDVTIAVMILKWLNKKGIRLAIDDFGTGYSSLSYLNKFPINNIKIDRSFVRDCLINKDNAAIVTTIATIAKNLNIQIIAEGVETEDQLRFINDVGCNEIQGYYFSPPIPPEEFTQLLTSNKTIPQHLLSC